MFHCKCRALTEKGSPFYFAAKDVPVRVYPDFFILANRPNTPLLEIASVCRVMDHFQLGEGDIVRVNEKLHKVTYHGGFSFISEMGAVISANMVTSCTLVDIGRDTKSKMQFKYQDSIFQLPSIFGCIDGKVVLSIRQDLVDLEEIKVSAGFTYRKQRIFYGDIVDGFEVVMWHGRPCILKDEGYVEVSTGILIGGVQDGSNSRCS